jgi:hypothetical protein
MQLLVMINGANLNALLNSGSTHNFIDIEAAQCAEVQWQSSTGLRVEMVNSDHLTSLDCCRGLNIVVGTESFAIDCYNPKIASYEMVLGVQWLKSLSPILWDTSRHTMDFVRNGHRVRWTATDVTPTPPHVLATSTDLMDDLLAQFEHVFTTPVRLTMVRNHCHRIRLLPGMESVAIKPYWYAHHQKAELECQGHDMLALGIIRPNTSSFSAPVLLVKKADSSWRLCIDYRALNSRTIKDKFPIPVVEEILDELHGTTFFTKLDLRSGYHQVLMNADNIDKTVFRAHEGLFEFLVMSFGLTNAPATFQSLMNEVLRPFLRRFVLVFFDDILIYSHSWTEHLLHVRLVLTKLQEHHLFVKCSKCEFGWADVAISAMSSLLPASPWIARRCKPSLTGCCPA